MEDIVDKTALASFLAKCQFKFGGISKDPDDRPGERCREYI